MLNMVIIPSDTDGFLDIIVNTYIFPTTLGRKEVYSQFVLIKRKRDMDKFSTINRIRQASTFVSFLLKFKVIIMRDCSNLEL